MEASSDDSFAWTNASCDSSNSDPMVADNCKKKHDEESESGKSYKKKLQKKLFSNSSQHTESSNERKSKKRKIKTEEIETQNYECADSKHMKMEPESDVEISKNKKDKHIKTNGTHNSSQESYDESYLNLRVKEEETLSTPKKKKNRRESNVSVQSDSNELTLTQHTKQKKAKKNKRDKSLLQTSFNSTIEDDDGIVQGIEEVSGNNVKKKKKKKHDESLDFVDNSDNKLSTEIILSDVDIVTDNASDTKFNITFNDTNEIKKDKRTSHNSTTDSNVYEEVNMEDCTNQEHIKKQDINGHHSKSPSKRDKNQTNNNMYNTTINDSPVTPNKLSQRTPKISDRIRFEDEEEDDSELDTSQNPSTEKIKLSYKLKQFLKTNSSLKPILIQSNNFSLTSDDELWVVRCPHELNINALKDANLKLDGKCKIKIEGQTYEGVADEESRRVAILTLEHSKSVIKNISLNGCVDLHKRIPKAHYPEDNIMMNNQTNFIPLPETKCRHPLFGSNYKKVIKIPTEIAERLKECGKETSHEISTKKKKNKKQKKEHDLNESQVMISEPEPEFVPKKKKKRKHTDNEEAPKKSKRVKYNPESEEAWESERAIEENLFNF